MSSEEFIIKTENLCYTYQEGTPFQFRALNNINIEIKKGGMVGIIGPTGSGKSTLIQHFNGLLKPTSGRILVSGRDINKRSDEKKGPPICFEVGLVFQYPEYQLFEETVFEDIAFGPRNMDLDKEEVESRVKQAIEWMALDFDKIKDRSPFSLSGGEMRRVALAGVLAMKPSVIVLDEPTAGLDPRGCFELRELLKRLHREAGLTLILVTHEMREIARMADHLIIINKGEIAADGSTVEIFKKQDWIREIGLGIPPFMELMNRLNAKGYNMPNEILNVDEAVKAIMGKIKK